MKVYEFNKNALEKIFIRFIEFKGHKLIDFRVFYNASENKEDWKPTPKGITIFGQLIPKLKEGVDKAFKKWEKSLDKDFK